VSRHVTANEYFHQSSNPNHLIFVSVIFCCQIILSSGQINQAPTLLLVLVQVKEVMGDNQTIGHIPLSIDRHTLTLAKAINNIHHGDLSRS
jgi:hypothetical protein